MGGTHGSHYERMCAEDVFVAANRSAINQRMPLVGDCFHETMPTPFLQSRTARGVGRHNNGALSIGTVPNTHAHPPPAIGAIALHDVHPLARKRPFSRPFFLEPPPARYFARLTCDF